MSTNALRLAILAAHAPDRDPRVAWEALSASKHFDTTVIGISELERSLVPFPGVAVHLLPPGRGRLSRFASGFVRQALRAVQRDGAGRLAPFLLVTLLVSGPVLAWLMLQRRPVRGEKSGLEKSGLGNPGDHPARPSHPPGSTRWLEPLRRWLKARPIDSPLAQTARFLWLCRHLVACNSLFHDELQVRRGSFQIIHCSDLDTLIAGVLTKRLSGIRVVYDAHEFWPYSHTGATALQAWFFRHLERLFIADADEVITVNPLLAEEMRRIHGLTAVRAVLNAEPWVEPIGPADPLDDGTVRFLYMGNFLPERGLEEFVDAWVVADVAGAVLCLRGPANRWRKELEAYAAKRGARDGSIIFLPEVREDQLVASARAADIGIIPYRPINLNYRFSCPNKLSQYLHAGLMILSNRLDYVANVVIERRVGLVYDSAEAATIAAAIRRAAVEHEMRAVYRVNALALARTQFNWATQEPVLVDAWKGAPL